MVAQTTVRTPGANKVFQSVIGRCSHRQLPKEQGSILAIGNVIVKIGQLFFWKLPQNNFEVKLNQISV